MTSTAAVDVVPATREDFGQIAELTVAVYAAERHGSPEYARQLADVAGRAAKAVLLVARDADRVVGSVALVLDGDFGEVTAGADEAAFRMLVVDPAAHAEGPHCPPPLAGSRRAPAAGPTPPGRGAPAAGPAG